MKKYFKILVGTAKEVEKQLNELKDDPIVVGMTATNETTTVIVELYPKEKVV